MDGDIRTIRLCRKTIDKMSDNVSGGKGGAQYLFTTDYFDVMRVEQKNLKQSFAEIMDVGAEEKYEHETTVQSYTLYFSGEMQNQYENDKNKKYAGNPFQEDDEKSYLGFIHVYISPEAIANMKYSTQDLWGNSTDIMTLYMKDLYQVLENFASSKNQDENEEEEERKFVARVYLMLSAGDFAVVVRSKAPETIYRISTLLRKREGGLEQSAQDNSSEGSRYVLYKTYTLLAMHDMNHARECDNVFVVRGCYSNRYWRDQNQISEFLKQKQINVKTLQRLNGRYDFSAHLTEKQFAELFETIAGYKQPGNIAKADSGDVGEADRSIVSYIKYLIENQYLSYINERYLMEGVNNNIGKTEDDISTYVIMRPKMPDTKHENLFEQNRSKIEGLLKLHKKLTEETQKIDGYRKKISQYLFLLKKQIMMCTSNNELSDIRIYTKILLEQMEVVLNSASVYVKLRQSNNYSDMDLDLLEDYLRKAVITLDCYAGYIRNNNMQSLQTPNYNMECAAGMEKVLIGYSELLWEFTRYYFYVEDGKKIRSKKYLPVVVPNLQEGEVNVEVLFPEGNGGNWTEEQKLRKGKEGKEEYLMVIGSSTLMELSDIPVMLTTLFHEVAHQFRYESRKKRNRTLLRTAVTKYMEGIAESMVFHINREIENAFDTTASLYSIITESLTEAYLANSFDRKENDAYQELLKNAPLQIFWRTLEADLQSLVEAWSWKLSLEERFRDFVQELRYNAVCDSDAYMEFMRELNEIISKINALRYGEREESKTADELMEALERWAFRISWMTAYEALDGEKRDTKEVCREPDAEIGAVSFQKSWDENFGGVQNKDVTRMKRELFLLLAWLQHYKASWEEERDSRVTDTRLTAFLNAFYRQMKTKWTGLLEQSREFYDAGDEIKPEADGMEEYIPSYHYWNVIGRCLGLDRNAEDIFQRMVSKGVTEGNYMAMEAYIKLYREVTADLLMCCVMDLEPMSYINLAAFIFVQNHTHQEVDIERLFYVLYIVWCCEDGKNDEHWQAYMKKCCELFGEIKDSALKVLETAEAGQAIIDRVNAYHMVWSETDEEAMDEVLTVLEDFQDGIKDWLRNFQGKEEQEKAVRQIENLLRSNELLHGLVEAGKGYWEKLTADGNPLQADLREGVRQLKTLHSSMAKNEDGKNGQIREIAEIGKDISEYLKTAGLADGQSQGHSLNKRCIELLLKMYYSNKLRNAQQESEGET